MNKYEIKSIALSNISYRGKIYPKFIVTDSNYEIFSVSVSTLEDILNNAYGNYNDIEARDIDRTIDFYININDIADIICKTIKDSLYEQ